MGYVVKKAAQRFEEKKAAIYVRSLNAVSG